MTKRIGLPLLLIALVGFSFQGCLKDSCQEVITFYNQVPVYKSLEEIRQDITVEAARDLEKPGKLYFYNNYVFINELRQGIHVIDNADPKNPVQVAFIGIPGNVDMAVQGNILYADNYIDLLAIDISNPASPLLSGRSENVFQPLWYDEVSKKYCVYYDIVETIQTADCQSVSRNGTEVFVDNVFVGSQTFDATSESTGGAGVGGSMARFTLSNGHLYTVDDANLRVFSLAQPLQPSLVNTIGMGWGIETIFPYQNYLFMGSTTGMYIYDNTTPAQPGYVSQLAHANSCDPVFVSGNYAYVTLRDGTFCQGFDNQLDLVNISNIYSPYVERTFPMENPHGLSIDENTLFLCEGEHGLKVFDVSDPLKLDKNRLDYIKNIDAYDVISVPGQDDVLLLIGKDGFYQYDSSKPEKLELLSKIPVKS
ncbi:MAG: hypothetical protein IPH04_03955 [Saprospirales bacterium]|nr:hypothetical protein [Saprospirales bacterium]MBK6901976.1 hypothetical protein [Saprospirales bacterium]MBK7337896.1 hypothetical protein [Saprospirales bacterium]